MKCRRHSEIEVLLCQSLCLILPLLVPLSSSSATAAPGDDLIACTNILRIGIEMEEAQMDLLRAPRSGSERPKARAVITEGIHRYANVSVQLKGFTTYRSIDDRPSLTLKFDRHSSGGTFHGLTKISLNNSLQDSTRLHEVLSRELFAAAGVPVPRASHVRVSLNGRDLGLYVLTEGYDDIFLSRYFERTDGTLYEGGTLQDIDATPRPNSGRTREDAALAQLVTAAREPDPEKRFRAVEQIVDMERFLSMVAMETILCHSDSYSMNRNNYRFYHDPTLGRFVFMPHGMDRVLGTHRSGLDLSIVPPQLGLVTRAVMSTPVGRRRYLDRLQTLVTNTFRPRHLCSRIGQVDELIGPEKGRSRGVTRARSSSSSTLRPDADDLCRRIEERHDDLVLQLRTLRTYLERPRFPIFDSNRVYRLHDWIVRPTLDAPAPALRCETKNGRTMLRLASTNGHIVASLRNRLTLPAGRYHLAGGIDFNGPQEGAQVIVAANRWSGGRFQLRKVILNRRALDMDVGVAENYGPEEIELVCDVQVKAAEFLLDISSLQLIEDRAAAP